MSAAGEGSDAPPLLGIVAQHVEEAAALRRQRRVLARAPHIGLALLRRHDERIAAHLDGIAVAGEAGRVLAYAAAPQPGGGEFFTAALVAIAGNDETMRRQHIGVAGASPDAARALVSAYGWASVTDLHGVGKGLLASEAAHARALGLAACAMHRVDPGAVLAATLSDPDVSLRAYGLRLSGECARRDLLGACMAALADRNGACRYWAARSAALLGERNKSVASLQRIVQESEPARADALQLVLQLTEPAQAHALLKELSQMTPDTRMLIHGAGVAGDPHYVPWLIRQMADPRLGRLAGESFSLITGLDLSSPDLWRSRPENFNAGPGDDPSDDNVAMDEDDGLPWPDTANVQAWWRANGQRFAPGARYFMGDRPSVLHCQKVLREGCQRQRILAAQYLCLLEPGTPLFPTSAPAWRQERWLGKMK